MTILNKVIDLTQKMSDELHATVLTIEDLQQVTDEMNSEIANLDDFLRPLKNYFYWEPHCFDIPLCWAFRSLFDALDGIDSLDAQIANAVTSLEAIDRLLPQMITQLKIMTDQTSDDMINVGNDFDQSRSDFFYIPREAFDNEDVKTGMTLTMSPDGKAARFIVAHEGSAMVPDGSGSGCSIRPWRAEAAVEVPVLNARSLHERMGHHRADEPETSAPQFNCELL